MTAPTDTRPTVDLSLTGRLDRLAEHVRSVADARGADAGFAHAILRHLAPVMALAAIQGGQPDQAEIYRAEAADRERAMAALQAVRVEVLLLAGALEGSSGLDTERARYALRRMRDVIDRADISAAVKVENPRGSQS